MRTYRPRKKDGRPYRVWYCEIRDHRGRRRRFPALPDRAASAELGRVAEKLAELRASRLEPRGDLLRAIDSIPPKLLDLLVRWDILDADRAAERQAAARPLEELLSAWGESIEAGGATSKHVEHATGRAGVLFRACGFRSWSDIRPEPVERHLRALRERDGTAIERHMRSLGEDLPANVRAFWSTDPTAGPRSVIKAGLSPKSSNHYVQAARGFCLWMVARGFAAADPLRVLEPLNARVDRRVRRRALAEEDLRRLIAATQAGPTLGLVPGPVRALAYALMAETGFRVRELMALRVSSFFDLDGEAPAVTLPAAVAKNRRESTLPLRRSTARALSRFLAGRGALEPALGLPAAWRPPRALRRDLASAGLPFEDESGRRFDAHALRGMLATRLFTSGASVPAAQSLMRHSTADLTVSVYSRVRGGREEREALERMPDLLPEEPAGARHRNHGRAGSWGVLWGVRGFQGGCVGSGRFRGKSLRLR